MMAKRLKMITFTNRYSALLASALQDNNRKRL